MVAGVVTVLYRDRCALLCIYEDPAFFSRTVRLLVASARFSLPASMTAAAGWLWHVWNSHCYRFQFSTLDMRACHRKASRGPSGGHARRSSSKRLCVARLPHESQPRPKAAATRAAAPAGGSVYCACHTKVSRGPSGGHGPAARKPAVMSNAVMRKV